MVWHTDDSYVRVPPAGSMLYALEVPMNGGGDTSFNNQYLAYEELPDDLKRAIEGKYQEGRSADRAVVAGRRRGAPPVTK